MNLHSLVITVSGSEIVASYGRDYCSFPTIRCKACLVLVTGTDRCIVCTKYRKILNSMFSRHNNKENAAPDTDLTSHTNYRYLTSPEKRARLQLYHHKSRNRHQKIQRMKAQLEDALEQRGLTIDSNLHDDLSAIVIESSSDIDDKYAPGSFARIFWDQQKRSSQLKDSRSMKWEPAMIR